MKQVFIFILGITFLASCNTSSLGDSDSASEETTYGDVSLYWYEPTERANGETIELSEIGGYEIRYKQDDDDSYTVLTVECTSDDYTTDGRCKKDLSDIPNPDDQTIEVAVFDTDGIYSDYVEAATE